ncbi:TlpA family protein disulfide reductase [Natronorubrum halophilum]|uniref:TlpA family protein disulfide reductase n=1 Tax=Natronorubrum halophilum TaxID=1702106 RepID=UPI000EF66E72|nr:TlpA disulfide reductase family protein [Natronorubrum halophilum]
MNRRELVAGIGSVGVLGGGVGVLRRGLPSFATDDSGTDEDSYDPLEVETIDARGSEAGSLTVPDGAVTAIMFFTTGCGNCQAQMPQLAAAREQLVDQHDDAVQFLSVTYQQPETMSDDDLREWWTTHGGDWNVGYDSGLASSYGVVGFPVTIVVDASGDKHWQENGVQRSETIVRAVESVLEEEETDTGDSPENDSDGNASEADGDSV